MSDCDVDGCRLEAETTNIESVHIPEILSV